MLIGDVVRLGADVTAWFEEFVSSNDQLSQTRLQGRESSASPESAIPVRLVLTTTTSHITSPTSALPLPPSSSDSSSSRHPPTGDLGNADYYQDQSPNITMVDSIDLPSRLFSALDQSPDGGYDAYDGKGDNDTEGEIDDTLYEEKNAS
jgi:hypothetical protein